MKNKFPVFFVILLLLQVILAVADEIQKFDPKSFDYQNGDYTTIEWSQINDWSKINWDKVNWDTFDWDQLDETVYVSIDFNKIPGKYAEKVDAKKAIDAGRGKDLPSSIIAENFEEIGDLSQDVDVSNAAQAIEQKYKVHMYASSLGPSSSIKSGVLRTKENPLAALQKDSLSLGLKTGWTIKIDDQGEILATPAYLDLNKVEVVNTEVSDNQISAEDHFTLDGKLSYLSSNNQKVTVEGTSFNGKQMYIKKGSTASIDDDNNYQDDFKVEAKKDINIYLDLVDSPQGNYIQLLKGQQTFANDEIKARMEKLGFKAGEEVTTRMVIKSVDEDVTVIPQPGNRLFNMVKRAYSDVLGTPPTLVADERDTLKITVSPGGKADIESWVDRGEVPELTQIGKGNVIIQTGRGMTIVAHEGYIGTSHPDVFSPDVPKVGAMIDTRTSVPMKVSIASNPQDQVVIGSSNKYMGFYDDKVIFMSGDRDGVSTKLEQNLMKTVADLQQKYPKMKFAVSSGLCFQELCSPPEYTEITPNMAQVTDSFMSKGGIDKFVKEIRFGTFVNANARPTDADVNDPSAKFYPTMSFGERVLDPVTLLTFKVRDVDTPSKIINHEFSHLLDQIVVANEIDQLKSGESRKGLTDFYVEVVKQSIYNDFQRDTILNQLKEKFRNEGPLNLRHSLEFLQKGLGSDDPVRISLENQHIMDYVVSRQAEGDPLAKQFEERAKELTGLYPYSFSLDSLRVPGNKGGVADIVTFHELPATFTELKPSAMKKNPQVAQLLYDRANSLGIKKGDPAYWIVEDAASKCKIATGSECKPCVIYNTFTCSVPQAQP